MTVQRQMKQTYLYRDCDQPRNGWFKSCFVCYATTARVVLFDEVETCGVLTQRMVYVCPLCKNALLRDTTLRAAYDRCVAKYYYSI